MSVRQVNVTVSHLYLQQLLLVLCLPTVQAGGVHTGTL